MKETSKLYYSMADIRKAFEIENSTIRFWCKEFGINPKRNKKGNRMFKWAEVEKIYEIFKLLKIERYTIEGAKMQLAQ